jgi:cytochrome c
VNNTNPIIIVLFALAAAIPWMGVRAADVDADAAQALMKKSGCFKCHSLTREKDAPPYKKIAAKYKSKPDAEQKLYTHLTTNPMVEVEGKKEKHESLKSTDDAEIKNVVMFILSQ